MKRGRLLVRVGLYLFLGAVVLTVVAMVLLMAPVSPLRAAVNSWLTSVLVSEFGPGAEIGTLNLGWRSLTLSNVTLPLDSGGTLLTVRRVEADFDPVRLLENPRKLQRTVRAVRIHDAMLVFDLPAKDSSRQDAASWIPRVVVPSRFYHEVGQLDSLRSVSFVNCRVVASDITSACQEIVRFNGVVLPSRPDGFRFIGYGSWLDDATRTLTLTGRVSPSDKYLEANARFAVPPGRLFNSLISFAEVSTEDGVIALHVETVDSLLVVKGSASFRRLKAEGDFGIVEIDDAWLDLSSDTVSVAPLSVRHEMASGILSGWILLRGRGEASLEGRLEMSELSKLPGADLMKLGIGGTARIHCTVTGEFDHPLCKVQATSEKMHLFGQSATEARAEVSIDGSGIRLDQLTIATPKARASAGGTMSLERAGPIVGSGRLDFETSPAILGWESRLRSVCFDVTGTVANPAIDLEFVSGVGSELGRASISRSDSLWQVVSYTGHDELCVLDVVPGEHAVRISGENVQHLLTMLVGDTTLPLDPIERLDFSFAGDGTSGDLQVNGVVRADSVKLWTQLAREFRFSGRYERTAAARTNLHGQWRGITGRGIPFEGRAEIGIERRYVQVDHFFIDEVGELRGWVDLGSRELDLNLDFTDLVAERLPVHPTFLDRAKLKGKFAGFFQVSGSLDRPRWAASVAMINGSVLNVPGYWINLEAEGIGFHAQVRDFELGRDVRRIVAANGEIDFEADSISVHAEVNSAQANDFFLALTGRHGLFTGELDARATVTGAISEPEIDAWLAIHQGELFGEIYADDVVATFQTSRTDDGRRVYRVPECVFRKDATYQFSVQAEVDAKSGGLSGRAEGQGDFLDLVDQVDRTFRTRGSECSLRVEIGGTLGKPELVGGELTVTGGRFTYTDACPNPLETEIALRLGAGGCVEPGYIRFRTGERQLEIRTAPANLSVRTGLEPLIIPTPRVNLGVLEVRSSGNGMLLRLPGLMKPEWTGLFTFGSESGVPVTISGEGEDRLLMTGPMGVRNARLTFPFVGGSGRPRPVAEWLMNRLIEARWDVSVAVGSGNHYDVGITGLKDSEMFAPLRGEPVFETLADYIDHLSIDAIVDPADEPVRIGGTIDNETFHLNGRMTSSRGKAEYLDQTFRVDYVIAEFDETDVMPILEGRGETQGVDSLGRSVPVYLTMYQLDRETNTRQRRGRLDKVTFVLESDVTETPEQTLTLLGYSQTDMGGKAGQVVASTFTRVIGRRWLDPLERHLERWTIFDEVTLSPSGGRGAPLARQQRARAINDTLTSSPVVKFFTGSQVTVGKYLTPDLFVTYTGELAEGQIEIGTRIGLIHFWNLEYRMNPLSRDLVLDFAVEYDEVERRRDESVSLKYSFALEP
ncbi:translocation/assembly module TamB domain-containing protein [bacterium]|nr:translocation/assembly module TamB domain-containing protein [bacterium]